MSNIASNDETVESNCKQYLNVKTTDLVNKEVNNNNIIINTTETTNNNTIIIIYGNSNFDLNSDETKCDKAVQTIPDSATPPDVLSNNIRKMENDPNNFPNRNNVNNQSNFKNLQTNEDEMALEEFEASYRGLNLRSNSEGNVAQGTSRNGARNKSTRSQNISGADARYVAVNNRALDNSQIVKILNQSERNKAVINSILTKFTGNMSTFTKCLQSQSKETSSEIIPSNKLALKKILDIMRKESPNIETYEDNNRDAFTQTANVRKGHKSTQTDPGIDFNNMELDSATLKEFLNESKIYFEEFQNKLHFLFLQYCIQSKEQKDKLNNDNQETFYDVGQNAFASGSNDNTVVRRDAGIDSNVGNHASAGYVANLASNTNKTQNVGHIANGGHTCHTENNHAGIDSNNNDKAFNAANSVPRQAAIVEEEQPENQLALVRAGRPRSEQAESRFSPYPRQQVWQQSEFNGRQRPPTHVHEFHNMNGIHLQHNSMIRPFNGWHTPHPPHPHTFFNPHNPHIPPHHPHPPHPHHPHHPHHHHHHHF